MADWMPIKTVPKSEPILIGRWDEEDEEFEFVEFGIIGRTRFMNLNSSNYSDIHKQATHWSRPGSPMPI